MPFNKEKLETLIDAAESNYGKVKAEYEKAREYIENDQAPTTIPSGKEYVTYNLLTSRVRRSIGELVNARINPVILGAGQLTTAVRELFNDILEENKFQSYVIPTIGNFFYGEGYSGLKFVDNRRKLSKYGIGSPEIMALRPDELWLDPNSRDGLHADDVFRIHPRRMRLEYAQERWPKFAKEISESVYLADPSQDEIKYCDVYEVEFREVVQEEIEIPQGVIQVEREVFYVAKHVNKTVQVEPPTPTGYPIFRLIPVIHTPRTQAAYGKYPFGLYGLLGQAQDMFNITHSVMLDAVKASIKQAIVARGATPEEEEQHRMELAKTTAYLNIKNIQGRLDIVQGPPLAPALTQWADRVRFMVDEQSQTYAPDRGQVSGELSGRAIQSLQTASVVPELTARAHIENALNDLAVCIYHYIRTRMFQPFFIDREIDGQEKRIFYNYDGVDMTTFQPDDFHALSKAGVVNGLGDLEGNSRIKISVELNQNAKRDFDINVALLLRSRGDLSLMDELKAIYPNSWQEKMRNAMQENRAQALVQQIAEADPALVDQFAQVAEQMLAQAEQLGAVKTPGVSNNAYAR